MNNVNGQLGFLDILNIASFYIGVKNYEENLRQNDREQIQHDLSEKAEMLLKEIHGHLKTQDDKLDIILKRLEDVEHENCRQDH